MQKKVLLVDDEASLRRTLTLGLTQEGFSVESCESGISALKKVEALKKDNVNLSTIVLDIKLPDINGVKLGKLIREKYPETAILFISGFSEQMYLSEIEGMDMTCFMSKPFTAKDLTYQMNELDSITQASVKEATRVDVATVQSASAYVMIKLNKEADFFEVYRQLYFMDHVLYCDATNGDYDIILLIQSGTIRDCKRISNSLVSQIQGIERVDFLKITKPKFEKDLGILIESIEKQKDGDESINDNKRDFKHSISSYLLVEFDPDKLNQIYPILRTHEQVVYCDYSPESQSLILFVSASHFNEIDKFIENEISLLDGVLKVKEYPVISMFEM